MIKEIKIGNMTFTLEQIIKYVFMFLIVLIFLQTCGVKRKLNNKIYNKLVTIENNQKTILEQSNKILLNQDSILKNQITIDKMIKLIEETPAWKTLEIEEKSDKSNISVQSQKQQ